MDSNERHRSHESRKALRLLDDLFMRKRLGRRGFPEGNDPMAKAELGTKRLCLSCSTHFFDLNRTPVVCPKCKEPFIVVMLARSPPRRPSGPWSAAKRPEPVVSEAGDPDATPQPAEE
jgi:hypothetical protein